MQASNMKKQVETFVHALVRKHCLKHVCAVCTKVLEATLESKLFSENGYI